MSSTQIETRERILIETWHLMEKRQGQGVRLEDIAQAAGISRQAVYLHFGSRSGLMIATVRYVDEILGVAERIQTTITQQTGIGALEAYVVFWANYIPEIYGLAKALLIARESDEAAAAAWGDRMDALYGGCLFTVQSLERDGVLAPEWECYEDTDIFWATLDIKTSEN